MAFFIATLLKFAQGSSTVSMIALRPPIRPPPRLHLQKKKLRQKKKTNANPDAKDIGMPAG
jgi:hypothetical protein